MTGLDLLHTHLMEECPYIHGTSAYKLLWMLLALYKGHKI